MKKKSILSLVLTIALLTTAGVVNPQSILNNHHVSTYKVEAATVKTLYKAVVVKNKAAIHTSNSGSSKVIGHLKKDKLVDVVQLKGSWMKIKYKSSYVWIYSKYVTKDLTIRKPSSSTIGGVPKAIKGFSLETGSSVRTVDVAKASNIKVTNTWSTSTKNKELQAFAKATGLRYSSGGGLITLDFVSKNI